MRQKKLRLEILTPEGKLLGADSLISVNIPLADGCPIGIKPGHAPLIAETEQGTVHFQGSNQEQNEIKLHPGVLNIRKNLVTILTPGELSTSPTEMIKTSETEYKRLITTLINHFNLQQD